MENQKRKASGYISKSEGNCVIYYIKIGRRLHFSRYVFRYVRPSLTQTSYTILGLVRINMYCLYRQSKLAYMYQQQIGNSWVAKWCTSGNQMGQAKKIHIAPPIL